MNTLKLKLLQMAALLVLSVMVHDAAAAVLIDDFTTGQSLILTTSSGSSHTQQTGSPANIATGTQLGNLTRTLIASASDGGTTKIYVGGGYLDFLTDSGLSGPAGEASIIYSFDVIDLASISDGLLLGIDFIDSNTQVEVIANNQSVFSFATLGVGDAYEIDFSQFSNPAVFSQLTSLRLNFRGARSWDASFKSLATDSNVPEPSSILLLMIGAASLIMSEKKFRDFSNSLAVPSVDSASL